jgi:hypothetical protein
LLGVKRLHLVRRVDVDDELFACNSTDSSAKHYYANVTETRKQHGETAGYYGGREYV